jgi:hypothetical protein
MDESGVSIVTPTSDRPEAFSLCVYQVGRFARPAGPIEWIVVDDGEHQVFDTLDFATLDGIDVRYIKADRQATPRESFRHNYLRGFAACRHDRVVIVEDDDYYHPDHLAFTATSLAYKPLVGCRFARFFHVRYRRFKVHGNAHHSSLAQTGFRRSVLGDTVEGILLNRSTPEQLDGHLWRRANVPDHLKLLMPESLHHVSIKGMPGKFGMGVGHTRENLDAEQYAFDPTMQTLVDWIGAAAANRYAGYFDGGLSHVTTESA